MKKSLFFVPLFAAALTFTSCSSDESVSSDTSFSENYDGQAYMRVRIAMPDGATTRAEGDFVNGSPEEQAIKQIGLKFYNADGSFYGYGLPVEDPTVAETDPDGTTVEGKVADAVIVLQINSNAPKPTHVVAYANCGDDWKQSPEPRIDEIDKTKQGVTTVIDGKTYYAMTSSNYRVDNQGAAAFVEGYQTKVAPESFQTTEELAKTNPHPVDIYVERLAAKVRVHTDAVPEVVENGGYELKFTIDGYALGGTNTDSYYIKHLDPQWSVTTLWTNWNSSADHRCYWAADMNYKNTRDNVPQLNYVSYEGVRSSLTGSDNKWLYSTENTQTSLLGERAGSPNDAQAARRTRAAGDDLNRYLFQEFAYVIGHYTVTKDGVEVTGDDIPYLYEYAGRILPHDAMLSYLQQTIGTVLYQRIQLPNDRVEYRGVDMVKEGLLDIGSYENDASLICLQLTKKATEDELKKYYIKNPKAGTREEADYIQVTTKDEITPLLKQSEAQAYGFKYDKDCAGTGKGGYLAYFPILIKHLNTGDEATWGEDSRGYYGVVRNHCYDITINSIKGLGIGIFNPDVDIIPKDKIKPLYLAAKFNVLSWRVVNQSVDL